MDHQQVERCWVVDCLKCGHSFCSKCNEKSHRGKSCEEARTVIRMSEMYSQLDNEREMLRELQVVRCPRCQMAITREGGCMSMKCRCGAMFCWMCKRMHRVDHEEHLCSNGRMRGHKKA